MALGLCCQWLIIRNGKMHNQLISRTLQFSRFKNNSYSSDKIKSTYRLNLENLMKVMKTIINSGIRSFRVSSSLFPLYDKVSSSYYDNLEIRNKLSAIGRLAMDNNLRLTTHPSQYIVLNSDSLQAVKLAIQDIDFHAWIFDQMGLPQTPYYSINIHGGKSDRSRQLVAGIDALSSNARNRLTIENCEFAYSVDKLLPVSKETGVPICFDSHHHNINPGNLSGEDAMLRSIETWRNVKPNTHISNSKNEYEFKKTKLRQHSDYLRKINEYQREANNSGIIDIDIEAKAKNLALFKASKDLRLIV